jgi:uncharacterized protein (TIGR01777 family)
VSTATEGANSEPASASQKNGGKRRVLVTGATGSIGRRLVSRLQSDGHDLVATSREAGRAEKTLGPSVQCVAWDYTREVFPAEALEDVTAVYHLMGENIGAGRWTRRKKKALRESRIVSTQKLVAALPDTVTDFLCASAIGVYPGNSDDAFDEDSTLPAPSSFMTQLCHDWEEAAGQARTATRRAVLLRIGVVLGEEGMLASLVPLYRTGLGGPLGDGRQLLPWIHVDDVVEMMRFVLGRADLTGPINLVGPQPLPLGEFSEALARALGRWHFLRVPAPLIRMALGEASALVLSSYNVEPTRAAQHGFEFRYPTLEAALAGLSLSGQNRVF